MKAFLILRDQAQAMLADGRSHPLVVAQILADPYFDEFLAENRLTRDLTVSEKVEIVQAILAAALAKEGVHCEILDLRSLRPLDEDAIAASVRKTHRCVVVHGGWPDGGVGAEIADPVQRLAFDYLDAPVLRVTTLDVPMPYNAKLEQLCMPQPARVVAAVQRVVGRR